MAATLQTDSCPASDMSDEIDYDGTLLSAASALNALREKSHIVSPPSQCWTIVSDLNSDVPLACESALTYLRNMRRQWRSENLEWLQLPHDWLPRENWYSDDAPDLAMAVIYDPVGWDLLCFVGQVSSRVRPLTKQEVKNIHEDAMSVGPDFCLAGFRAPTEEVGRHLSCSPETIYSRAAVRHMLTYREHMGLAEFAISAQFGGVPGAWLRMDPESAFHPPMTMPPPPSPDFAMLHHPLGSSSSSQRKRDKSLRVSIKHPALVIGVKGPMPWPTQAPPSDSQPTLDDIRETLAQHMHPNLETLLIAWHLQQAQKKEDSNTQDRGPFVPEGIPDWAFLCGVIYDADNVHIVAHIPFLSQQNTNDPVTYRYLSLLVDTLPLTATLTAADDEDGKWAIGRLRVALALMTVQRQAFRVSSILQEAFWLWPKEVQAAEEYLDGTYRPETLERMRSPSASPVDSDAEYQEGYFGEEEEFSGESYNEYPPNDEERLPEGEPHGEEESLEEEEPLEDEEPQEDENYVNAEDPLVPGDSYIHEDELSAAPSVVSWSGIKKWQESLPTSPHHSPRVSK